MAIASTATPHTVAPVLHSTETQSSSYSNRNTAIDCVRGFAVLGILFRNIYVFGLPNGAYSVPLLWGDTLVLNVASWAFTEIFVDGVMRALFSMLFGASALMILHVQTEAVTVARVDRYYRRLLCLTGLGLVHGYILLWPFDVLFFYGLLGLFLFPLRNLSAKSLIAASAFMIALSLVVTIVSSSPGGSSVEQSAIETQQMNIAPVLTSSPIEQLESEADDDEVLRALLQDWIDDYQIRSSGYISNFVASVPMTFEQQTTELYKTHALDIGALMLIGMALFKLGVLGAERSTAFYIKMALVGYGIGMALNISDICATLEWGLEVWRTDTWTYLSYDIGRISIALGHLSVIVLLVKSGRLGSLVRLFVSAGRMALTNYMAQTVICIVLFFGFGFGLFAKFEHYQLLLIAVVIGATQLFASAIWLRAFGIGPLERLLRFALRNGSQPPSAAHDMDGAVAATKS